MERGVAGGGLRCFEGADQDRATAGGLGRCCAQAKGCAVFEIVRTSRQIQCVDSRAPVRGVEQGVRGVPGICGEEEGLGGRDENDRIRTLGNEVWAGLSKDGGGGRSAIPLSREKMGDDAAEEEG